MIQTCILDLDGPLLDGRLRHYACYRAILDKYGYTPLDIDTYWQMKRERLDRRQQLAATNAEAIYEEFLRDWVELIEQPEFLSWDRIQPGVGEKLQQWRSQGVALVLATMRHSPEHLMQQLADLGIDKYLDEVVVCRHSAGGQGKTQQVKERLPKLVPARCLWIGDTEVDIEAARALGCPVWAVTCGLRTAAYLRTLSPDYLSSSLLEVDLERLQ